MDYNKFRDISCCEEFEIQCDLHGISKIDVLNKIGHQINDYYFFISNDGIFNWFDLSGNHIEDPGVLNEIIEKYIHKNITKCIIPVSVTHIGEYSFYNRYSLKEITIPDSVTCIDDHVFPYCESLTTITLSNNMTSIGNGMFSFCDSLQSITIPNSVKCIGEDAFSFCKTLQSITIPNSVTRIGDWAFCGCKSLKEVNFEGKTLEEVKQMKNYPFGFKDESIIKCKLW